MKMLKFGDNAATIGGKRVPYSLLGAMAAILGAFLIWKFNQNGGLQLGGAASAPDLGTLTGTDYTDMNTYTTPPGSNAGFAGGGSIPTGEVVVPNYTYNYAPASSPVFGVSAASAPAVTKTVDQPAPTFTRTPGVPSALIAAKYPVYTPPPASPGIFSLRGYIAPGALAAAAAPAPPPARFNPVAGRTSGTQAIG